MSPRGKNDDESQLEFGIPSSSYEHNADMASVADRLIGNYPEALGHIKNWKMVYLRRTSRRADPSEQFSPDKSGHAFIRSDRERGISAMADAGVWLMASQWDHFQPEQRTAWMHHMLLHFAMTPEGKPILVGHDAEGFAQEARIYGAWQPTLKLFAEGLDANASPQKAASAPALPRPPVTPPATQPN